MSGVSLATRRAAVVQMVSGTNVAANLETAGRLLREARAASADVAFLPENFAALAHPDSRALGAAEAGVTGPVRGFLATTAADLGMAIVAGTVPTVTRPDGDVVDGGRVRAACFVVDAEGAEIARYDKMHMFDVEVADRQHSYLESATFEPGTGLASVDTAIGRVGLSVCYDVRFPELYRRLAVGGAEVLSIPSAFTVPTGEAHFVTLLKARAIENFCFVVAACQGGSHESGRETWGHSMIVNPWGETLVELDRGEGVGVAEIDLDLVRDARQKMPVFAQRRLPLGE